MSLLLSHGHHKASTYPVWMVFVEADIVVARVNAHLASEIALLQMALSSIPNQSVKPSATKKVANELKKQIKDMLNG